MNSRTSGVSIYALSPIVQIENQTQAGDEVSSQKSEEGDEEIFRCVLICRDRYACHGDV